MPALLRCTLLQSAQPAQAAHDKIEVRAYVNDTCIIADEPFFLPVSGNPADQATRAKFLPLLGLVVGKLAELFINHEIQSIGRPHESRRRAQGHALRAAKQMNLYRADFAPAPALRINAKLGCMTIVAANFKPEPADCTAEYVPKELSREIAGPAAKRVEDLENR